MDFWVRSQDKMTLKKINDISISQNLLTNVYTIFCDHNVFGDYATKERALEVLDEIQNILNTYNRINGKKGNYEDLDLTVKVNMLNYVYEMPKE